MACSLFNVYGDLQCNGLSHYDAWHPVGARANTGLDHLYSDYTAAGIDLFFGKMFGQTMMHLFSVICIFIAGYLINGVSLSAGQWVLSGLWILIGSLPFLAIGTLVGAMKRVDTASGVSNVIYMALAVAGGMWMPIEILPRLMQRIGHWLPSYNYGNGAWEIVRGSAPTWSNVLILLGYLIVFMLLSVYIRKNRKRCE